MSDVVIKVEDVSKQYRLGTVGTGTLSHDLNRWWARLRGKADPTLAVTESNDRTHEGNSEYVWALNDINFEVKRGEVLGIIGRNGAGKSTLLKILSRVTAPTTGSVKVKGRIASLLEVGTGFHPELTGRENIYLNGAIMGMTRREVSAKLDEIVDFSGCERYLDTPVKRYSSGMTVRLGFAVAAHLEPEILVVDEVLAVGDAEFQKKCIGKMKDVAGHGRTVLFVSHNMGAVANLCTRGLLIDSGKITNSDEVEKIIESYLEKDVTKHEKSRVIDSKNRHTKTTLEVEILSVSIDHIHPISTCQPIKIMIKTRGNKRVPSFRIAGTIYKDSGTRVGSFFSDESLFVEQACEMDILLEIVSHNLSCGNYYIDLATGKGGTDAGHVNYDIVYEAIHFAVERGVDTSYVVNWNPQWGSVHFPVVVSEV
ncbi:ABC transporter [bacterium M21]|nr:ABC transporter [bacterium M21]